MAGKLYDMDYYKSLVPSQVLTERGSDVVVICPGSMNLRMGLASSASPLTVPHVIAWLAADPAALSLPRGKGSIGESQSGSSGLSSDSEQRKELLMQVEDSLHLAGQRARLLKKGPQDFDTWTIPEEEDSDFKWTNVYEDSNTEKENVGQEEGGLVPGRKKYRRYICGEEALNIAVGEPYSLRRPMRRGHLSASLHYSMQQVADDLCAIWEWVLSWHLSVQRPQREAMGAVLVAPDTLESREVKELVNVAMQLGFQSVVVHQESVAVAFGTGISSACIVSLGAQSTSVVCVEDGAVLPTSRLVLPYGGQDVSRCVAWAEGVRAGGGADYDYDYDYGRARARAWDALKEAHCRLARGRSGSPGDPQYTLKPYKP